MATPSAAGNQDDYHNILMTIKDETPVVKYYDRYLLTTNDFAHLVEAEFQDLLHDEPQSPRFLVTGEDSLDVLEELYYGNSFSQFFDQIQLNRKPTETNTEGKAIRNQVLSSLGGTATEFALGYTSPQDPFFGMFTDQTTQLSPVGIAFSSPNSYFIVAGSPHTQKKWGYRFSRDYFCEEGDGKSYRVSVSSDQSAPDVEPSEEFVPKETLAFMNEIRSYFSTLEKTLSSADASLTLMYETRAHLNGSKTIALQLTYSGDSEKSTELPMSDAREVLMNAAEYIAETFGRYFPKLSDRGI